MKYIGEYVMLVKEKKEIHDVVFPTYKETIMHAETGSKSL